MDCKRFVSLRQTFYMPFMSNMRNLVIIFLLVSGFFSCASKKELPVVKPEPIPLIQNYYTDLVIHYKLDKTGLTDTLNRALDDIFKDNYDLPEYDIKMTLSRPGSAFLELEGKKVLVTVPVTLNIEKKTFLTSLKARGTMEMTFLTDVDIDTLWNLKTITKLSGHKWTTKPKLSVAGVELPIETISDYAVKKSKPSLEQSIDQSIRENFTLRQKMKDILTVFDQPFAVGETAGAWLTIKPERFQINRVLNTPKTTNGKIAIKGFTTISSYKTAPPGVKHMPKVYWSEQIPDSSVFRIVADIKTEDINRQLQLNLDGKTFTSGDKSITLTRTSTACEASSFTVTADITGSAKGTLILKGKPEYDRTTHSFLVRQLDIQFKTKNVIHKAAAWIAEGKIRHELESRLRFSLGEATRQMQATINQKLRELNQQYGMDVKVGLGSTSVENFEILPGQIRTMLSSKLYFEVGIRDLRSFNRF